jgi:hypothetical protein
MEEGSGRIAISVHADSTKGFGSATIHMDAQQAQRHRRFNSDSNDMSDALTQSVIFLP